jgi:hypothetical protein
MMRTRLSGLFKPQQTFYEIRIRRADQSFLVHYAFALFRFLSKNVAFESFLEGDLPGAGDLESLFGTRVGFNLWHFLTFLYETLLAVPHRRNT